MVQFLEVRDQNANPTSPTRVGSARGLILVTMWLGVLIAQIDTSVVNLAVKPIGTDGRPRDWLQSNGDVYDFVYASLLLTAGTLADLYGGVASLRLGSRCSRSGRWCAG